jgi:hypothetical protein
MRPSEACVHMHMHTDKLIHETQSSVHMYTHTYLGRNSFMRLRAAVNWNFHLLFLENTVSQTHAHSLT